MLWLLSFAGAALVVRSAARVVAVARAGWRLRAVDACPLDSAPGVYEVPGLAGISLAGVVRARILVGSAVRRALDRAELDVALAHERAHRRSLDNVKRFVMFCAPDVFGAWAVAREVESRWHATAESLADARAVGGDGVRAVHLASALVKVSRLASASVPLVSSPAWSTLHDPPLLEQRVRRLVNGTTPSASAPRPGVSIAATGLLGTALVAVSALAYPAVHQLTEALVRVLP
jgi:Zn-dependent protease with chaperone function